MPRRTVLGHCRRFGLRGCTVVGRAACGQWATGTAVQAGRELGHGGFGPVAFDLFFYFLNIFKSMQIQKFV
jgi:hypothetical protein